MTTQSTLQSEEHQAEAARAGVLLIHGLNGSLWDMAEIEQSLRRQRFATRNMLLPGHGSQVRDMLPLGWPEWAAAVRKEFRALKERHERVFVVGHSLGGALALHTAAHEDVAGVVSMCAPISMQRWLRPLIHVVRHVAPLLPTVREDVHDPEARRHYSRDVYRWTPMRPVESMLAYLPTLRTELPRITAPALIMVSLHDHVVPARDGREIYHLIGSREKHLVTFRHSYHVIMKDYDRAEVLAKTEAFLLHHAWKISRAPFS